jgi:integrase
VRRYDEAYDLFRRLTDHLKPIFAMTAVQEPLFTYFTIALPPKRLQIINPVRSLRHSCALHMFAMGNWVVDIKNRLGHDNIQSTMTCLHQDLTPSRQIQKRFIN